MNLFKAAVCAAALTAAFGLSAASAADTDVASVSTCIDLAAQVRTALDANAQSANYAAADKERLYGHDFCTNGFYARGAAHYGRALALLGTPRKS